MRVRKNAATMTLQEWERLMNAFVALKHTFAPGSTVSVYDQFVAIHLGVWALRRAGSSGPAAGVDGAHGGPAFLSWHREYLNRMELALQSVDPTVTIPYWNWGLGPDSDTSTLFQDNRVGPEGSGGSSGFDLATGYLAQSPNAFNPLGWTVHPQLRPYGSALQRNAGLNPASLPTATAVNDAIAETQFSAFRPAIEGPHGTVHLWVGRDMRQMTSPNDPVFFMHHCQIDRIWAKWQQARPGTANYNPLGSGGYGHRLNDRMWPWDGGQSTPGNDVNFGTISNWPALTGTPAATDIKTSADVIDHKAMGYCYDDEPGCPCEEDDGFDFPTTRPVGEEEIFTTLAIGEEVQPTTLIRGEEDPTTLRFGEEDPTTLRIGEEGPTTLRSGEEGPTTMALGEEGPRPTTMALGEEGPGPTTMALGEEDPFGGGGSSGGGNPFGGF